MSEPSCDNCEATLGAKLRHARRTIGWTLRQAAASSGIAISSICDFEHGKREPRFAQLARLAEAYHRSIYYFLDDAVPVSASFPVLWCPVTEGGLR